MTFGIATIAPRVRSGVYRGKKHDCGKFGFLTSNQIAQVAGISIEAVYLRHRRGDTGEALCAPAWDKARKQFKTPCAYPTMLIACQLAKAFPDRLPSTKEIQAVRPMSRQSAVRWKSALRDALERVA